jgi:Na+/H+ antiporter NhaB
MDEQHQCSDDGKFLLALVGCAIAAAIAYALIMLLLVVACVLAVAGIAGAGYLGFRMANDKSLWRLRKAQEVARIQEEKELHLKTVPAYMRSQVENIFEDEQDGVYKRKDRFGDLTKGVRAVREMFR